MSIMLKGPARAYFAKHVRGAQTYEDVIHLLRKLYNNRETKYRLLSEW